MTKNIYNHLVDDFNNSYALTCQEIDRRGGTPTRKRLLKETAKRLTELEFAKEMNRRIDLKGMIREDIRSRKLREKPLTPRKKKQIDFDELMAELDELLEKPKPIQLPKCRCPPENIMCFCVDKNNRFIR